MGQTINAFNGDKWKRKKHLIFFLNSLNPVCKSYQQMQWRAYAYM